MCWGRNFPAVFVDVFCMGWLSTFWGLYIDYKDSPKGWITILNIRSGSTLAHIHLHFLMIVMRPTLKYSPGLENPCNFKVVAPGRVESGAEHAWVLTREVRFCRIKRSDDSFVN